MTAPWARRVAPNAGREDGGRIDDVRQDGMASGCERKFNVCGSRLAANAGNERGAVGGSAAPRDGTDLDDGKRGPT